MDTAFFATIKTLLASYNPGSGKAPQILPTPIMANMTLEGSWDASLNSPALRSGTGYAGGFYLVSVAGTTMLDGINVWAVNDYAFFNPVVNRYQKIDGATGQWSGGGHMAEADPISASDVSLALAGALQLSGTAVVAALGSIQGDAAVLTTDHVVVTGADGTKGVRLPATVVQEGITIINSSATLALKVWPAVSSQINALGVNAAFTIGPDQMAVFYATSGVLWYCPGAAATAQTVAQKNLAVQGIAAGYKIARGRHTMLSASDTVVTGLATVVAVVASLDSDPVLTCDRVSAAIGDQAGAPAAGSVYVKAWMPTSNIDGTPTPATGYASMVADWIAIGT